MEARTHTRTRTRTHARTRAHAHANARKRTRSRARTRAGTDLRVPPAATYPTLTQVLRRPRTHFKLSSVHNAPRAPEMLDELYPALKKLHHPECTQAYQCFDKHRRSCFP